MKKIDTKFLKPEDFIINVRPYLDSKRAWTGQVEINIMSSKENGLSRFDNESLFHLCTCMSALVPMMEVDKDLLFEIEDFVKELRKKERDYKNFVKKLGAKELSDLNPDEIKVKLDQILDWNDNSNKPKKYVEVNNDRFNRKKNK